MLKQKVSTRRKFYFLGGLIIIIIAFWLIWTHFKYHFVSAKLHDTLSEKTGGLYHFHYDSLFLDEVGGTLRINNLDLFPDTAQYATMLRDKTNPPMLLSIHVPEFNILRVQTPKALLNKEIVGGKIEIAQAFIQIELSGFLKDTTAYHPAQEIYKQILGQLKSIKIDSIQISHSTLIVKDLVSGRIQFKGIDFSILLTDLLIDSIQKDDSTRILFSRNLELNCQHISIPSKDKKYLFQFENIGFNSANNQFSIGQLNVLPKLSEPEFAKESRIQKDRYDFHLQDIRIFPINREALWHKRIEVDSMIIVNGSFKIFRDLSYPHDSINRVGIYPQQQIKKLPLPVYLKKIVCRKCFVEYKEKNAKSDSSGKVQFADISATISNVTNMPQLIAMNNHCILDFRSRFLKKSNFIAKLDMLLGDREGRFTIDGSLSPINAEDINPLIQPMALARIERGSIDKIDLHFLGHNFGCSGKVLFLYHDMKVAMLKKNEGENKYQKKALASFAANFIMKDSNPKSGQTRFANPEYKRDIHKSIFNLMWKTLFSGIKETAGVK